MGNTSLSHDELRSFIEDVSTEYYGDTYHLIVKNCNHFTNDLTMRLVGKEIPGFINRMARIGLCINCVLPEYLKVDSVKSPTDYQQLEGIIKHMPYNDFFSYSTYFPSFLIL